MIRKYKDGEAIAVGQWVCFEGLLRHTIAPGIAEVLDVLPKSVRVYSTKREEETTKLKRLIRFVCDTEQEAETVREASLKFQRFAFSAEDDYLRLVAGEKSRVVAELTGVGAE